MTQRPAPRRGLGRGLGSLIPTAPRPDGDPAATPPTRPGVDWIDSRGADPAWDGDSEALTTEPDHPLRPSPARLDPGSQAASGPTEDLAGTTDATVAAGAAFFAELDVASIVPNPRQPREVFDEQALAELVHSIREVGLLQPVVVRPLPSGEPGDAARYELVMGERRWRATQAAGLGAIPAIVRETADADLLRDALLENLHRAELNPLEEAAAYQQLLEDFGCTHDELAERIGRSRPQISNTLRLLKLSLAVQRRVAAGVLSAGHARALVSVTDPERQDRLAGRVVAEGISVRGLEEIVALGDDGQGRIPAPRRNRPTAPGLGEIAARLADRLDTRVKVDLGRTKGKIVVEFASLADLERIIGLIDPGSPAEGEQRTSVEAL